MTGYDGRGARFDITIPASNDFGFTVTAVDGDSVAVNLSTATIVGTVYNSDGTAIDTLTASVGGASDNVITLSMTDAEVDALVDPASWALVVTRAGDSKTWLAGRFFVVASDRARNGTSGTNLTATVDSDVNVSVSIASVASLGIATDVEAFVRNVSGSTITKGTPVYITGYNVGQNLVTVEPADASSTSTMPALGLASADIDTNATGSIITNGRIADIDTSSFSVGDRLYVSETTGALTATRPTGAAQAQSVGVVVRSNASNGVINVAPSQTFKTGFSAGLLEDGTAAAMQSRIGVERAFDVTIYGAAGDGSTNDSDAIQSAIDACSAAGGGIVYFPAGTFIVGARTGIVTGILLSIPSDIALVGAGLGATTLKVADDAGETTYMIKSVGSDSVRVAHLTLDGNKSRFETNPESENEGINVGPDGGAVKCTNVTIHDVRIHSFAADAIDSDGCDGLIVTNCVIEDNDGNGVHAVGAARTNDVVISDCIFRRNALSRALWSGSAADDASAIDRRGDNTTITGCQFDDNYRDIVFHLEDAHVVSGCTFAVAVGPNIEGTGGNEVVVSGCTFFNDAATSNVPQILLTGGNRWNITGCQFRHNNPGYHNVENDGGSLVTVSSSASSQGILFYGRSGGAWAVIGSRTYGTHTYAVRALRPDGGGGAISACTFATTSGGTTIGIAAHGAGATNLDGLEIANVVVDDSFTRGLDTGLGIDNLTVRNSTLPGSNVLAGATHAFWLNEGVGVEGDELPLTSPNGTRWRISISDAGVLSTASI